MAQAITAHSSFVYLVEHIPDWQTKAEDVLQHATVKKSEFQAEYTRLVNQIRPKRKKSPSVTSIHDVDQLLEPIATSDPPTNSNELDPSHARLEVNPLEAGNRYLYAQAHRKRKPEFSVRSGASGPQKFRSRNQMVVYYDGSLQDRLNALVKEISLGRNNLRKGKNALVAAQGFQLPRLTSRTATRSYDSVEDIRNAVTSRSTPTMTPGKKLELSVEGVKSADHNTTFIQVDKELDSIQSLCEVAAHQFLRDGDSQTELKAIKQKLGDLLGKVTVTAKNLQELAEEQSNTASMRAATQSSPENASNSDSEGTLSSKTSLEFLHTPKLTTRSPLAISHTLDDMKARGVFLSAPEIGAQNNPSPIVADDIEVDDTSDQEDILIDITAYRMANARRVRA